MPFGNSVRTNLGKREWHSFYSSGERASFLPEPPSHPSNKPFLQYGPSSPSGTEGTMPSVDEDEVYSALLKYRLDRTISTDNGDLTVRLRPVDNRVADSPDFLLWVEVEFELFGKPIKIAVPLPVEAEKGGIAGGALDDLRKLVERRRHLLRLPMIVVSESGHATKDKSVDFPTNVTILQLPIRCM
jgi:hypothetical protein